MKEIVIFGRVPPPFGGVTISVKNLIETLEKHNLSYDLFSSSVFFSRYKFAHINYSKPWKIFIASLVSKLIAKKSIFIIHGNDFDFESRFNLLTLNMFDGVIALNDNVLNDLKRLNVQSMKLTPLLNDVVIALKNSGDSVIERKKGKRYVLIYINDAMHVNGREVYGAEFFSLVLPRLPVDVIPVILDIKNKFSHLYSCNEISREFIYFNHTVNFIDLLKQVDVYLRPTSNDGSSVAILEAMALGVPVLASDAVSRPENVFTYEYGNQDNFLFSLDKILSQGEIDSHFLPELNNLDDLLRFVNEL